MPPRSLSFTSSAYSPSAQPMSSSTPITNKYTILFIPHSVENVNVSGHLAVVLEDQSVRSGSGVQCTSPVRISKSNRASFQGQKLNLDITFTPYSTFSPRRLSFTSGSDNGNSPNKFRQKYVTIKLCMNNKDGAVVTSTSLCMNRFLTNGNFSLPGKKMAIGFDDNTSMKATLAVIPVVTKNGSGSKPDRGNGPLQRRKTMFNNKNSPTSIMSPFPFSSSPKAAQVKKIGETITDLTSTLKETVKESVNNNVVVNKLKTIKPLGYAYDNERLLVQIKTENEQMMRRIATYRTFLKDGVTLEELRQKQLNWDIEKNDLKTRGIPVSFYLDQVEQLCKIRRARADMQLEKEHVEHVVYETLKNSKKKRKK